jgi:PKHD-type hydroxylase
MVLYPASSLHGVEPVTRGTRHAAILWLQSMVGGEKERELLESLKLSISEVRSAMPDSPTVVRLIGLHHNLLRLWSEN